jgi:hypothetical protein
MNKGIVMQEMNKGPKAQMTLGYTMIRWRRVLEAQCLIPEAT